MVNKIENGGLNRQDISCKIKLLQLKCVKKMMEDDFNAPWNAYINTKFTEPISEVVYHNYTKQMYPTNFIMNYLPCGLKFITQYLIIMKKYADKQYGTMPTYCQMVNVYYIRIENENNNIYARHDQ